MQEDNGQNFSVEQDRQGIAANQTQVTSSHRLPEDQFCVLKLIDGQAGVSDLADRVLMNDRDLQDALMALVDHGFIRELIAPGRITDPRFGSHVPALESDLDFTQGIASPVEPLSRDNAQVLGWLRSRRPHTSAFFSFLSEPIIGA